MSDLWLGALRTKMESVSVDPGKRRWAPACAGATPREGDAVGSTVPEVKAGPVARERATNATFHSRENAR